MTPITIGLGAFAVALMALVILYAAALLINVIAKAITGSGVPFAGDLASGISGLVGAAVRFWSPLLRSGLSPLAAFLNYLWRAHSTTNVHAQQHAAASNNRMHGVVHTTIPKAKATAIFWANAGLYKEALSRESQIATAEHDLQSNINTEHNQRVAQVATAEYDLQSNINAERAQRIAQVQAVVADLQREIDTLAKAATSAIGYSRTEAADQLAQLRADLATQLAALGAYTQTAASKVGQYAQTAAGTAESNAVGYANSSAAAAVAGLWPGVAGPAERARQGVAVEAPGVLSGAPAIPVAAPTTLAGTLAAVATMAATAATFVDECGLGLCTGLGGLATLLTGLEATGLALALVAIGEEVRSDPAGATTAMHDLIAPPADAVLGIAGGMFGLSLSAP